MLFEVLTPEIAIISLSRLDDVADIRKVGSTCKRARQLINDPLLVHLWLIQNRQLVLAARLGCHDAVLYLTLRSDQNQDAYDYNRALFEASKNGHVSVVQLLMDRCTCPSNTGSREGSASYVIAQWMGYEQVVDFLVKRGHPRLADSRDLPRNTEIWLKARKRHDIRAQKREQQKSWLHRTDDL